MTFVFDRNLIDIQVVQKFREKILEYGFKNLTDEEKSQWLNGLKGCLNYTDLNRIEENCRYLAVLLNIVLPTKIDWAMARLPTAADYQRIRDNVNRIRDCIYAYPNTPNCPDVPLNVYTKINDIEKILYDVHQSFTKNNAVQIFDNEIYADNEIGVL